MRRCSPTGPAIFLLTLLTPSALAASDPSTLFAQAEASAAPVIAFEQAAVVVSGLAPGAEVAWLSLASEPRRYYVRDTRREGIERDDDGDGTVVIALDGEVPPRSVWGVVDLASGLFEWSAPVGFELQKLAAAGEGAGRDGLGRLNRLIARRVGIEALWARPGTGPGVPGAVRGAWALTVFDGSPGDRDGAPDGGVAAALDEARPFGESPPPPEQLLPGDVVLVIDPRTYQVFTVRLPGGPEAALRSGAP